MAVYRSRCSLAVVYSLYLWVVTTHERMRTPGGQWAGAVQLTPGNNKQNIAKASAQHKHVRFGKGVEHQPRLDLLALRQGVHLVWMHHSHSLQVRALDL